MKTVTASPPSDPPPPAEPWPSGSLLVRPARLARRTDLRGVIEANETYLATLEILPDYAHCGINE